MQEETPFTPDLFFGVDHEHDPRVVKRIVNSMRSCVEWSSTGFEIEARIGSFDSTNGRFSANIGPVGFKHLNAAMNRRCEDVLLPRVKHIRHPRQVDTFFDGGKRMRFSREEETGRPLELVDKQDSFNIDLPISRMPGVRVSFSKEEQLPFDRFSPTTPPSAVRHKNRVSYALGYWTLDLTVVTSECQGGDTITYEAELEFTFPDEIEAACADYIRGNERLTTIATSMLSNMLSLSSIVAHGAPH